MLPIDAAAHASAWRRRHPADKAVLSLGLLGCAVALPPWPGAVLVAVTVLVIALGFARVPARRLWRAARAPLGFAVTGALTLLVSIRADGVGWAPDGPRHAGELVARSGAAGLAMLLFAFTTPLSDVLPRLTRVGVPAAVVDVAAVMYRMLFLLYDTTARINQAQAGRLGHRTRRARWRSVAGLGSAVFVHAFARARRLEEGLAGRGYDGRLRVLVDEVPVSRGFVARSVFLVAAVVVATLLLGSVMP
ncbi:cobalt ECF transporter T component CbiQ [Embleya scabrispora]|uniref:Cobalt ECF transporter T component CbiQ n=1 Tax=Embleya scabrispora TaxID=159449 RepID=A0A1T3P203_9ACTN|nr:cobalt ECF transporter T component CbiQ [Embleya scabrispora]OPC82920.1 cobalt ECF transporter T component CbiQ [Embleya scabrispora]